jgi:hypothetical protein
MKKIYSLFLLNMIIFGYSQPNTSGMYFNGNTEITVPNTTNINSTSTNNRTYETYFKADNVSAGKRFIMKEGGSTRAVIIYTENGYLYLGAYNQADYTPNWKGTFYRTPITSNVWYHIALVFDNAMAANNTTNTMNVNTNTALKFYLNGSLVIQKSGYQLGSHNSIRLGYKNEALLIPSGTWTTSGSVQYSFGTNSNDTGANHYYFVGNIWGFRVWNDVRTPAEINNNKNNLILNVGTDNLVAALDGDELTYLNSSNAPEEAVTTPTTIITWKSNAATTAWETSTNWVGDMVPDSNKLESVKIVSSTNYPIINSNVKIGDLDIDLGASLTVNSNSSITVNYDVINNGNIFVENNANFIQQKNTPNTGNMTVKRKTNQLMRQDYVMWSSPVSNQNLLNFSPNTLTTRFYEYNTSNNLYNSISPSSNFNIGTGYLIRLPNNFPSTPTIWTGTFTGVPNNGIYNYTLNTTLDGFNAVGNPYPSTIDMVKFVKDNNTQITGTLYFWRKTNSTATTPGYCTWNNGTFVSNGEAQVFNPNGAIQTGQGFIVKALSTATSLNFNNTQRINNLNNQTFRIASDQTDEGKYWLNLTSDSNEFAQMAVTYSQNATQDIDSFDGEYFNTGSIALNSIINNKDFAIQGRSLPFENTDIVPLSIMTTNTGNYTISIDHLEGIFETTNQDIYLKDNLLNTETNLRNGNYTFASLAGSFANRFEIIYQSTLSVSNLVLDSNNVIVYKKDNNIVINSGNIEISNVKIFDISGRLMVEKDNVNSSETKINIDSINQLLLVQITSANNFVITKKVVN